MKIIFCYTLAVLLIFNVNTYKVHASDNEAIVEESQIIIANKYAEKFCSAKSDHFFEGLDNEKVLKYSYFKYIGLLSEEMYSKEIYQPFINKIKDKCLITKDEEREINELFFNKSKSEL